MKGLFKGMTYPLLGQAGINAIVFGVERAVYRRLQPDTEALNVKSAVLSGLASGAIQSVIVCPMELIKIRMQNQGVGKQHVSWVMTKFGMADPEPTRKGVPFMKEYRGPLQTTKIIIKEHGFMGIYKGWWATVFREVPQFGIYFGTFEWLKMSMAKWKNVSHNDLSIPHVSIAGGVTGVVTWCWYPIDVIKTRFQSDGAIGQPRVYNGIIDCVIKSVRAEGMGVLFRGLQPTLFRGFLNGAATFPVYTLVLKFLNN